ncbi:hypothetical protein CgunFtcFv8_017402 [Champsocephalus gunnari]|uniref:Uncharacterized protein n=1 Tax=Champsocephalus gunnari TaxID=52237 RepID=A0AAN8DKD3_CHAGU|nr:hypothetical protein CgunFtcFv8_017402 [Champsocephalus gunnari]
MREGVEGRLGPQRMVEGVGVHSQGVAGGVEVLRPVEVVVVVVSQHDQGEEEEVVEGENSHQVEVGEEVVEEVGGPLHPLEEVVEVGVRAQLDPLQSANTG